jgi:hypothetical protein
MSVVAPPPVTPPSPDDLEALIREARERQLRRRLLGAAALAIGAAIGLGAYALSVSGSPSTTQGRGRAGFAVGPAPRCRSSQLRLSAPKMWGAAAGSLIEQFTLTNTSGASCIVAGWPTARRFGATGQVIPVELSRWVYRESGPAPFRQVRLRPGGAATFPIFGQDWNHAADRACPNARKMQIRPRGSGGWLSLTLTIPACQAWDVGPLVPGHLAPWPTFALSQFYSPPTVRRPFYSGRANGIAWRLQVRDSGDGRYCFKVFTDRSLRATRCGRFYAPGLGGKPVKLGWVARNRGPSFVAGAVVSVAKQVAIHLSDGSVRYLQTMPPNRLLAPGISFFFTSTPAGSHPVSITAHNALGRVVVAWKRRD